MIKLKIILLTVFSFYSINSLACYDSSKTAEQKFSSCLIKADRGDSQSQLKLGIMYFKGDGVPKNKKEGFKWVQRAALQGYTPAEFHLGYLYMNGQGVNRREKRGIKWIKKAAFKKHAPAQLHLGHLYLNGRGIAKNKKEGFKWIKKAARQGFPEAIKFLNNKGISY